MTELNKTPEPCQIKKTKTHIRIKLVNHKRLKKLRKLTGKTQDTINNEVVELGLSAYPGPLSKASVNINTKNNLLSQGVVDKSEIACDEDNNKCGERDDAQ